MSSPTEELLFDVQNLSVGFQTPDGYRQIVGGFDLQLRRGETVAIVGESGSGKTVSTRALLGLAGDDAVVRADVLRFGGQSLLDASASELRALRGAQVGYVLQDALVSLDPLQPVRREMAEALHAHARLDAAQTAQRTVELLADVGVPQPEVRQHQYPGELSGGLRQRALIATALAQNPPVIIADEPTTALDVTVQAQILALMENLVRRFGSALILITHDLAVVSEMTDRVAVMYCGRVVEEGPTRELVHNPFHPYTKGLLESIPRLSGERSRRLPQIPGMVPSLFDLPPGCSFAPRCGYATELCRKEAPRMRAVAPGRKVSCHNPVQGGEEAEGHGR
mgnify:CR=1 FL=1